MVAVRRMASSAARCIGSPPCMWLARRDVNVTRTDARDESLQSARAPSWCVCKESVCIVKPLELERHESAGLNLDAGAHQSGLPWGGDSGREFRRVERGQHAVDSQNAV